MNTRRVLFFALLAFAITLAIIVGWRMSAEAMAVVIGVIAGVAASIPTSLIIIWITLRGKPSAPPLRREPESDQPRVIVVNATPPTHPTRYPPTLTSTTYPNVEPQRPQRRFTIIGGEEEEIV